MKSNDIETAKEKKEYERRTEIYYLRNRIMHVNWEKATDNTSVQSANNGVQSAKLSDELPPKCKNCTLEEVAVLRVHSGTDPTVF